AWRPTRFTLPAAQAARARGRGTFRLGSAGAPRVAVLLEGRADIAPGRCGEPIKLNLGDIGYYRVEYDAASHAALVKSAPLMTPADRVNLLADSWALVEAGRAEPRSYFEFAEQIRDDDSRAVWEQIVRTLTRLDHLARNSQERAAIQS